jgi:hypothetical protein
MRHHAYAPQSTYIFPFSAHLHWSVPTATAAVRSSAFHPADRVLFLSVHQSRSGFRLTPLKPRRHFYLTAQNRAAATSSVVRPHRTASSLSCRRTESHQPLSSRCTESQPQVASRLVSSNRDITFVSPQQKSPRTLSSRRTRL